MAINYNDSRFQQVEQDKQNALNNVNNLYNNMVSQSDKYYQDQINASKDWAETQKENQQAQTDFTIEKIEQQKDWARQDYIKEQKGSYADWQKQSNQYGANAEAMATNGMTNTGYSESSQVSMYNTYQNRVATARETFNRAIVEYDNSIKEAQLANNSALAEIAYNALKTQLELSLQGFQYKNTLLQQQLAMQNETEDRYYNRWKDVQDQINTENALAEQQRQFNAQMALEREKLNREKAQSSLIANSSGGSSVSGNSSSSGGTNKSYSLASSTVGAGIGNEASNISSISSAINKTAKAQGLSKKVVAREMIDYAYKNGQISSLGVQILSKKYGL